MVIVTLYLSVSMYKMFATEMSMTLTLTLTLTLMTLNNLPETVRCVETLGLLNDVAGQRHKTFIVDVQAQAAAT